jgi:hypothetical protein
MIELVAKKELDRDQHYIQADPIQEIPDMSKIFSELLDYDKTIIGVDELQKIIGEPDYSTFQRQVEQLAQGGALAPVRSSGTNGRLPPLSNRYRIIRPPEDYTACLPAIRLLNPALNIAGYLNNPALYRKHEVILKGLNHCLWYTPELLKEPMSRKERSFSLWSREKLLDEHRALIGEVLKFNGLNEDWLNCYDTPEPFFEYVHTRSGQMTVLILENKDTWYTFRKLMQDTGKGVIAGKRVDVLIYGEGNKITKRGALDEYNAGMLRGRAGQAGEFLYFGDLDQEGIRLFFRTREANPGLDIRPFAGIYLVMLKLAAGVELPKSLDKRGILAPVTEFADMLGLSGPESRLGFLKQGRYIPQEIVNYQVVSGILSQ